VAGGVVLFDGCLRAGGEAPLLRVRAGDEGGANLRVVRSTLVCGRTLLIIEPAQPTDRNPAVRWFGWDSLLSRSNTQAGGDLVSLPAGAGPGGMKWDACNCLYAGWENLLTGAVRIPADDVSSWRRQWNRIEGGVAVREPWPAAVSTASAELPAGHFRTAETPVGFASSVSADKPLGCDLDALPAGRENWGALTYERFAALAPEAITDASAPPVPVPGDDLYHGERLDLDQVPDLGLHLRRVQQRWKLGPRVVLHLAGKGEKPVTPIRVKGSTLVLYFEPPADEEAKPLALAFPARERGGQEALIEVEGGGLEVIGGELRLPEGSRGQVPAFLLKVRGGDLRLYRCRLEGPQLTVPDAFRGLISLAGSGRPEAEQSRACAVNECVLVSGRAGVRVEGIGARLLLRQSLVAAGGEAVQLVPGSACRERANVQCLLEHVTVAARQTVVHLGDTSYAGVPREPVVIQSHDSAFLNPFGKPNRAGMLLYDGEALSRGLLVWQGEEDVLDRRLYFGAWRAGKPLPDRPEGTTAWTRLWGSYGVRRPVLDLSLTRLIEPGRWQLDRLALPAGRGADLALLGVKKPVKPAR
jgi:hypothetical protein